ncbi:MAG: FAD-binding oxidoreductase [Deltaproteobacteria bacterium]|nr:FAD-binding oxidoreductase [Deltaproteobacteria bacterium]
MDLKSGYPFWAIKNGLMTAFPPLTDDVRCDVAIVGGGITGALIADEFSQHGHAVVVLEQRDVGWGSSAASTALLQYEIDTHMTALAQRYGEADAVLAYRACLDAIPQLQAVATELGDVDFATTDSLYYASKRGHAKDLREEFAMRRAHGLPVEFLEAAAVRERFSIAAPCAILSTVAARVDPYRMACRLLTRLARRGGHVFDRTTMDRFEATERGVTLHTPRGACVHAGHVVLAAGYAGQRVLGQRVARTRSSYAFITDPIDADTLGPFASTMVWESARPYLYLRSTGDGRLLVGGDDDAIDLPARRDRRVETKARSLNKKAQRLLPDIAVRPCFAWAGTFAETEDGLPFFGPHAEHGPRVHFAMAYGGNGITYSMLGGGLLRARIEGREHPLGRLFGFDRIA